MANVPQIRINGTDYNVKDETARNSVTELNGALNDDVKLLQTPFSRDVSMYKNLMFTPAENVGKTISLANGTLTDNSGTNTTDYFPAIQGKTLYFSKNGIASKYESYDFYYIGKYDGNFKYLGYETLGSSSAEEITYSVGTGEVWYRVCYPASRPYLQIEYDEVTAHHIYGALYNNDVALLLSDLPEMINNSQKAFAAGLSGNTKTILNRDGNATYDSGYGAKYFVTDFLPVSLLIGGAVNGAEVWTLANGYPIAFYDAHKKVIGTAYTPDSTESEHSAKIELTASFIANYPNAKYVRIGGNTDYKTALVSFDQISLINDISYLSNAIEAGNIVINDRLAGNEKSIIKNDGSEYYNASFSESLFVSDMLTVAMFKNATVKNALAWTQAVAYPIAFYDANQNVIGSAYSPDETATQHSVDILINDALLENFPNAVYFKIGGSYEYNTSIELNNHKSTIYPPYKINAYHNIFFAGDSVTAGFVTEGTAEHPETIYEVMPEYSYPKNFERTYANANITTVAQSGISAYGYYNNKYPDIDFSQYDLVVIELGLNATDHGMINIDDIDTENTNTWCLKKIVQGIRNQNAEAQIAIVRSQYYMSPSYVVEAFEEIARLYNAMFIDLHKTTYLNLADAKYHGYYNNSGTPAIDYAHFTRRGYAAKSYVIAMMLNDLLPE